MTTWSITPWAVPNPQEIPMFERFTDRARRAVTLAQEHARALGHDPIGTEHLLLGLIHEGEGIAGQVPTADPTAYCEAAGCDGPECDCPPRVGGACSEHAWRHAAGHLAALIRANAEEGR